MSGTYHFTPAPPGLAAVVVEVDDEDGRHYRPRPWPVIGYDRYTLPRCEDRFFAVVLDRDGEAIRLHDLLLYPDPVSGLDLRCIGFVSLGNAASPPARTGCRTVRPASPIGVPA